MKRTLSIITIAVIAALLLALGADLLLPAIGLRHETIWENWHLLFIGLGLIGALLIIMVAKALANYWLGRKEDYYD